MGLLMRNGIGYSGGGGSESGDVSVYGAFIDPSRIIVSSDYTSNLSYTATEDCFFFVGIASSPNSSSKVYIDGEQVYGNWNGSSGVLTETPIFPMKNRQTITVNATYGSSSAYVVYGVTQGTNGIFAPVIYSDEERCIGVWRDNKPLYQKTVDIAQYSVSLVNSEWRNIFTISDLDYLVSAIVHVQSPNVAQLLRFNASGSYIQGASAISINLTDYGSLPVTFQYTKTTDVAGSGNWNTDGTPTVHYDGNEKVIGTWFGDTLYQKTIKVASLSSVSSTPVTPISISDIPFDMLMVKDANVYDNSDNRRLMIPNMSGYSPDRIFSHAYLDKSVTPPVFYFSLYSNGSTFSNLLDLNVTIQYTKTT